MDPALICLDKRYIFSQRKSAHTTVGPSSEGEFFFINTPCSLMLSNPQNRREDKGFVWSIDSRR